MAPRREIRFLLNDETVTLAAVAPEDTLLDFLRLQRRLTGTKEGCAEGDCGACTVLVGRLAGDDVIYEPVNACIRLLPSLDACHVVTVEHLAASGSLHPVQAAMVAEHGSQCGFCTPGIVMALAALWMTNPAPSEAEIETALQGNLCRCTGYAPIIRAAQTARPDAALAAAFPAPRAATVARLQAMGGVGRVEVQREGRRAILPADVDDLAALLADIPEATLVAGATDAGLWVTKALRRIAPAIFIGHLDGLRQITEEAGGLRLAAGVTYTEAAAPLCARFPHLAEFWGRIAGWQVRSMGTLGGNIANGSPIGDTPPAFIALGAELTLRRGGVRRTIPLEDFFLDYGRQDRLPGEFVESLFLPHPSPGSRHAAYKVSKRRDEDISTLAAAFNLTVQEGRITAARIAFGGMAATPKRAAHAEAALVGMPWAEQSLIAAAADVARDFTPISDMRASAEYRMTVARNLFRRFYVEHAERPQAARLQPTTAEAGT